MNFADNNILLILISLVFIYAVLSILVSIIVEWLNYLTKERAKHLKNSIYNLLGDKADVEMGEKFYNHIMINGLQSLRNRLPAYISSGMFSEAFIDIIAQQSQKDKAAKGVDENQKPVKQMMVRFEEGVAAMEPGEFKELLQSFIDKSGQDYAQLKAQLENWYNDYMERVSGGYKLNQRKKLLYVGFLVAIALNVDSIHLLKVLSLDDNLKNKIVAQADQTVDAYKKDSLNNLAAKSQEVADVNYNLLSAVTTTENSKSMIASAKSPLKYNDLDGLIRLNDSLATHRFIVKDSVSRTTVQQLDSVMNLLSQLNVPIGWSKNSAPLSWFRSKKTPGVRTIIANHPPGIVRYIEGRNATGGGGNWLQYLIGIVISGLSLSFGAPFWFDMLVKLVNVRRAGKVPEVTKK
ncbi:MAG: hypothetical protein A3D31_05270 [Candidatus Fluviicola riflensis]|nr:MAG: hypothetical protein CHH17_09745 [Candidatus Fluviicola riflensis]OGS79380.1 MAG: hypothetical protein A3D31_05270 [Candidatus Fluviicola riflensis]OGS86812.1 MAG: hypothetical protein A2724_04730 [Fluviicola sp. RIFCSPHIGHO2_01_FULL_43_53]OGS89602.1 MAG: hypothetical protein A3E30_01475 [Fluviicola sp. RIFCSPHIGHO2_12_FULL_43_24]